VEFEFNADLANHLGCLMLPVLNGLGREGRDIADDAAITVTSLEERQCDLLAVAVNRLDEEARNYLKTISLDEELPLFLLGDLPILEMPTVGEMAHAIGAKQLAGPSDALTREIADVKVAAMQLPNFLEHLSENSLVIVPGDRADIIVGCVCADRSVNQPRVAGLVLSGALPIDPQISALLEGMGHTIPILGMDEDTYTTAAKISAVESVLGPDNPRKIAAALAVLEESLDYRHMCQRIRTTGGTRTTPLQFEYELVSRAKRKRQTIVLPEGEEERILRAAEIVHLRQIADIVLLGNPDSIRRRIATLGLRLGEVRIIDPIQAPERRDYATALFEARRHKGLTWQMASDLVEDLSYFGTLMVHTGAADGMVSGAVHTTQHTIRPAFQVIRTSPESSIISSVFLMSLSDRVLVYGDCAVNPDPNAEQLAEIALSSARTARQFGIEPRVAMLSYSTGDSGQGEAVEKVRRATEIARAKAGDILIEGPIQYDAASDPAVAKSKMPGSEVAGRATVFIFPDLNTGNNTYKAVQRTADAVAIGPILQGLNKPVNDLSRGCTITDIVNTVAITAIQAQLGS
jgi:phosphate acetyltransferase